MPASPNIVFSCPCYVKKRCNKWIESFNFTGFSRKDWYLLLVSRVVCAFIVRIVDLYIRTCVGKKNTEKEENMKTMFV